MNNISEFTKCANCGACYNICPRGAIIVEKDKLFYELKVDTEKCIDCGLCKKVCPVNNEQDKIYPLNAYAAYNRDYQKIKQSSSGGVFIALAEYILSLGGVVYGAAYGKNCKEVVIKSTDEVHLTGLLRSKYVESSVGQAFQTIKVQLESGRQVLFCGAPCQVAGLKKFLHKEYENLLTCDFSCGGMPSHKFYQEYLDYLSAHKFKAEIESVNFRPKLYGWKTYAIEIKAKNKKAYRSFAMADPYFYAFIGEHISVRDYCYDCKFADNHASDIILADFWLVKKISAVKDDNNGLSLVISNTQKGEKALQNIDKQLMRTILDLDKASYNLVRKSYNTDFIEQRKEFLKDCENNGFIKTAKKKKRASNFILKWKHRIKKLLGRA